MFRVALCDDDRRFLELLKERAEMFCVEKARNVKFSAFSDSDILMGMTERGEIFDAYILDIEMQDYSGIEIAEEIRKKSKMACIIFLTSHMKYAVGACGTGIFRYMMKEDLDRELPRILDDLFSHLECLESHYFYVIQNQKRCIKFSHREVVYIYKDQKNAVFVMTDGRNLYERTTLDRLYQALGSDEEIFFLDRGIILNLFHVRSVGDGNVRMDTGHEIPSSPGRIEELKRRIRTYWGKLI